MVFTLVIAGIALLLLLLGTAIPQLRGMITEVKDLELSDGLSVSIITEFIIYYNFIYHKSIYRTASSPSYNNYYIAIHFQILPIIFLKEKGWGMKLVAYSVMI